MRLDSVRELKASLTEAVLGPLNAIVAERAARGFPGATVGGAQSTIALGIVSKSDHDYALAVRIQRRDLESSPQLDQTRVAKALATFASERSVVGVGITRIGEGYGVKVNLVASLSEIRRAITGPRGSGPSGNGRSLSGTTPWPGGRSRIPGPWAVRS